MVSEVAAEVRSRTISLFRTEKKAPIVALRESLPPEDQMLLILRVDRGLAWNDLVLVFHDGEAELSEADLKRESARLRKRFQSVKERLFQMAKARGLVEGEEPG
jgi:RNA polymerase sigma-70 factor (ECF subfamily)